MGLYQGWRHFTLKSPAAVGGSPRSGSHRASSRGPFDRLLIAGLLAISWKVLSGKSPQLYFHLWQRGCTMIAGWQIDEVSDSQMLATYKVRGHTVVVSIDYSADDYSIRYKSSIQMKVKCGVRYDATEPTRLTTGRSPCPGGAPPTFIHQAYKDWLAGLSRSIQATLKVWSS